MLIFFIKTWIRTDDHKKEDILTDKNDSKRFSQKKEILADDHK